MALLTSHIPEIIEKLKETGLLSDVNSLIKIIIEPTEIKLYIHSQKQEIRDISLKHVSLIGKELADAGLIPNDTQYINIDIMPESAIMATFTTFAEKPLLDMVTDELIEKFKAPAASEI